MIQHISIWQFQVHIYPSSSECHKYFEDIIAENYFMHHELEHEISLGSIMFGFLKYFSISR